MFKSLTIVSVLATAAFAQTSSSIPTGISAGCTAFLTSLNTDAELTKCTSALSTALASFAPGAQGTASQSTVTSALTSLCSESVSSSCPTSLLATKMTEFYRECSDALTTKPVDAVIDIYDLLYVVAPFKDGICSKNNAGDWCLTSGTPPSTLSADAIKAELYTQDGDNIVPNTSAFSKYDIPFLFIDGAAEPEALCVDCTRSVLNAYIQHESVIPYALGLAKSKLLQKQQQLFSAVTEKCGASWMEGEVKAASGLSGGLIPNSGALPMVGAEFQSFVAAFAGFATLAASSLL